ncbi:hypothetical protein SynPROS91_00202 [Synechococcus sp. PROS-9-1]|nr:hypothetical protein SynPROS91_00202 [Synechococcus sp. PROS-9-1]
MQKFSYNYCQLSSQLITFIRTSWQTQPSLGAVKSRRNSDIVKADKNLVEGFLETRQEKKRFHC